MGLYSNLGPPLGGLPIFIWPINHQGPLWLYELLCLCTADQSNLCSVTMRRRLATELGTTRQLSPAYFSSSLLDFSVCRSLPPSVTSACRQNRPSLLAGKFFETTDSKRDECIRLLNNKDQLSLINPARRTASRRTCRWTLSAINLRPS